MNKDQLWKAALGELQLTVSKTNFALWLAPTFVLKIKKVDKRRQLVEIATPNPFARETVENRYYGQIKEVLDKLTGKSNELRFVVKERVKKEKEQGPLFEERKEREEEWRQRVRKRAREVGLKDEFTFQNFAVSSTNEMAYAAAQAVADDPGGAYHLLFLYGGVGVGKTHLMQAIGHKILEKDPEVLMVYCTGEEFTNEIIEAIRRKTTEAFRQKYRKAKVLLIDDVQFIGGKDTVQEEFFHTFNTIHREGGQIVMTSDRLPSEIEGLEDRLRSRFEGGLTVDIQQPNFELRTAILLIKARARGVALPMDVAQLIAANIESTRKLEGFLMRLISESRQRKEEITPEMAKALLGKINGEEGIKKRRVEASEVLETVAEFYSLKVSQLKGPRRLKELCGPRHLAMYLLRTELEKPLEEIGKVFGGRDHTTVMHAIEKIQKELAVSEALRLDLATIRKRLYG